MAEFAALTLFTDSFLADTGHLSDEEFGRYMRLLIVTWRSPRCKIPNDIEWISKRLRVDPLRFNDVILPILKEFFRKVDGGNYYTQKRLKKEFIFTKKKRQKQRMAAKSRWGKEKYPCKRNAPSPSPSPSVVVLDKGSNTTTSSPLPTLSVLEIDMKFQAFWNAYPGRGKDGAAGTGFKGSRAKALESFTKLLRQQKVSEDYETIIGCLHRGAAAYSEHLDRSGYPSKHAVTWLNQRGWEDDYSGTGPRAGAGGATKSDRAKAALLKSAQDLGIT